MPGLCANPCPLLGQACLPTHVTWILPPLLHPYLFSCPPSFPPDTLQVIRLCEGCRLFSALAHIYNQMGDYRKPLLDLTANLAAAATRAEAQAAAYKLLVYLRCCFKGLSFPPGTGSLPT